MKNIFTSKRIMTILTFLGLYLFATGTSWAIFSFLKEEPSGTPSGTSNPTGTKKIGEGLPKTESCPINGMLYSKPEREIWEQRRPLVAMIENSADARPQSGLGSADVVYEALAEGGVTRFAAVFYCGAASGEVDMAPIRSARVNYIDWAAEYGAGKPIYLHFGGANNICSNCPGKVKPAGDIAKEADAFKKLDSISWRNGQSGNDFDGGSNIGYPLVVRDQYRLSKTEPALWEHSVVAFSDKIFAEAQKRGFAFNTEDGKTWLSAFRSWKFSDDAAGSSSVTDIKIPFLSLMSGYDVEWKYDKASNSYLRFNGSSAHLDHNDSKQLSAKNVVVQFTDFKASIDKEKHVLYTSIGKGNALIFQNGNVIKGTWQKKTMYDRTVLYDDKGSEVSLVKGPIWIEIVPTGNDVTY
jgi:hypothetical protein